MLKQTKRRWLYGKTGRSWSGVVPNQQLARVTDQHRTLVGARRSFWLSLQREHACHLDLSPLVPEF